MRYPDVLAEVAKASAMAYLAVLPDAATPDELIDIDTLTYHKLVVYRHKCVVTLKKISVVTLGKRWVWFKCQSCKLHVGSCSQRECGCVSGWFQYHWDRLLATLMRPHPVALKDSGLTDIPLEMALRCDACKQGVIKDRRSFMNDFKKEVQKRILQVSRKVSFVCDLHIYLTCFYHKGRAGDQVTVSLAPEDIGGRSDHQRMISCYIHCQ